MQEAGGAGPSFPCEKATTSVEKLICSDRSLSALDLEYSRLYGQRLQESDKPEAEEIRSRAKSSLQTRDNCANDRVAQGFRTGMPGFLVLRKNCGVVGDAVTRSS